MKMGKKHSAVCGTKLVAMHLEPNCLDLASMSNKLGADWTTVKQIYLSLVEKFSVSLTDMISILWNPFDFLTPSLPDDSSNLGGTPQ